MTREYTEQNAAAWNEIADLRYAQREVAASYFAEGNVKLHDKLIEAAGDVNGLAVLQLQCATGHETISWAVLGARATGLDISDRQMELAREKADEAGIDVTFLVGDVLDLPDQLTQGSFDLVHTGGGSLMWIPDIEAWAKSVASALRPGGRLLLLEEHPVAGVLAIEDGRLVMESDYFRRKDPIAHTGWRHFEGGEDTKETKYQFEWPLGDIITALARNGMRIDSLEESPSTARWRFGDDLDSVASLPGTYLLVATREDR